MKFNELYKKLMEKREEYFIKDEYKAKTPWRRFKGHTIRKASPEEKKLFNVSNIPIVCRIQGKILLTNAQASDDIECFKNKNLVILLCSSLFNSLKSLSVLFIFGINISL